MSPTAPTSTEAICTTKTYAVRELYGYVCLVAGLVWFFMTMAAIIFPFKPIFLDLIAPVIVMGLGMYLLAKNKKEKEIL